MALVRMKPPVGVSVGLGADDKLYYIDEKGYANVDSGSVTKLTAEGWVSAVPVAPENPKNTSPVEATKTLTGVNDISAGSSTLKLATGVTDLTSGGGGSGLPGITSVTTQTKNFVTPVDVTADLTAAINALNTAGGGTLYIPPGRWSISSSLPAITVPCTIYGAGPGAYRQMGGTTPVQNSFASEISTSAANIPVFNVKSNSVRIHNLRLTGPTTPRWNSCAVLVGGDVNGGGVNVKLENILTVGFWTAIDIRFGSEWVIDKCHFAQPRWCAVRVNDFGNYDAGDSCISSSFFYGGQTSDSQFGIFQQSGGGLKLSGIKINTGPLNSPAHFRHGVAVMMASGSMCHPDTPMAIVTSITTGASTTLTAINDFQAGEQVVLRFLASGHGVGTALNDTIGTVQAGVSQTQCPLNIASSGTFVTMAPTQYNAIVAHRVAHVTSLAKAASNATVVTDIPHNLSVGDPVTFLGIQGMTQINGSLTSVTAVDSPTQFHIAQDTSGFSTFTLSATTGYCFKSFGYDMAGNNSANTSVFSLSGSSLENMSSVPVLFDATCGGSFGLIAITGNEIALYGYTAHGISLLGSGQLIGGVAIVGNTFAGNTTGIHMRNVSSAQIGVNFHPAAPIDILTGPVYIDIGCQKISVQPQMVDGTGPAILFNDGVGDQNRGAGLPATIRDTMLHDWTFGFPNQASVDVCMIVPNRYSGVLVEIIMSGNPSPVGSGGVIARRIVSQENNTACTVSIPGGGSPATSDQALIAGLSVTPSGTASAAVYSGTSANGTGGWTLTCTPQDTSSAAGSLHGVKFTIGTTGAVATLYGQCTVRVVGTVSLIGRGVI
jgi:hypothetical protein